MPITVLGLGSNLDDRIEFLSQALNKLKNIIKIKSLSSVYESKAVLLEGSPDSWNKPFLNMVLVAETTLSPEELLETVKRIEHSIGRNPEHERWSPREIDIDILAYDNEQFETESLIIPHRELLNRDFFVIPISEIFPEWKFPVSGKYKGKTILQIAKLLYGYPSMPDCLKKTDIKLSL